jgi:hypothetical protein
MSNFRRGERQQLVKEETYMKTIRLKAGPALAVGTLLSLPVLAGENTGARSIVDMGCDNVDSICYIDIAGAPVGTSLGCSSNYIEWDSINDPNGKNTLATLLAAFASGKLVNVYVNSCLAARPSYPTIWYFNVYN